MAKHVNLISKKVNKRLARKRKKIKRRRNVKRLQAHLPNIRNHDKKKSLSAASITTTSTFKETLNSSPARISNDMAQCEQNEQVDDDLHDLTSFGYNDTGGSESSTSEGSDYFDDEANPDEETEPQEPVPKYFSEASNTTLIFTLT